MLYLCVIQARIGSSRFPNKVMQTVGGKTMVRRVWDAAKQALWWDGNKVIVLWPERNPDVPEDNLFEPFRRLVQEFSPHYVIRLTADCPLITSGDITQAIIKFEKSEKPYYNNGCDGRDVQIFTPEFMLTHPNRNHVLDVKYNYGGTSVNTPADLERVRKLAR